MQKAKNIIKVLKTKRLRRINKFINHKKEAI